MSDRTEVNRSIPNCGFINHPTYTGPGCAICGNQINMHRFLGDRLDPNPIHIREDAENIKVSLKTPQISVK